MDEIIGHKRPVYCLSSPLGRIPLENKDPLHVRVTRGAEKRLLLESSHIKIYLGCDT